MAAVDALSDLGSYTGPDGTIITELEKILPVGFAPYWLIVILEALLIFDIVRKLKDKQGIKSVIGQIAFGILLLTFVLPISPVLILTGLFLLVSIVIVWNFHRMQLKGMLVSLLFLWLCSYLLFSNALAGILAGVGAAGMGWWSRRLIKRAEFGTRAEQAAAAEMGFPIAADTKAIKTEKKIERMGVRGEHGELGALGAVTEEAAKLEERTLEATLHVEAIAAGEAEIGKTLEQLHNAELTAQQRNARVEEMLRNLDAQLKNINKSSDIDAAATKYLEKFMADIIRLMGELVNDEKYEEQYRKRTLGVFRSTVKMLKDASSEAGKISRIEFVDESGLKAAAKASIRKLGRKLNEKERALEKAFERYAAVKDSETKKKLKGGMDNISKERDIMKQEYEKLVQIGNYLHAVLGKHNEVLKKLRADASRLTDLGRNLSGADERMEKYDKSIEEGIAKMKNAYAAFEQAVGVMERGEIPEELAIVISTNTGNIFGDLAAVLTQSKAFVEKELMPFMEQNRFMIQDAYKIQESAEFCNIASMRLNDAVKALGQIALDVIKGEGGADQNKIQKELLMDIEAEKWEENISRFAAKKGIKTKNVFKQAENQLAVGQQSAHELLEILNKEIAQAEYTKKLTLDALVGATDTLLKNRVRINKDFQAKADEVMSDLKKEKVAEVRAKASA
ncbi:hypothetical protein HZB03_01805 [Candidatus Woesearchaeota archaeon]|nr:hypothetical protein [Candidatus Woesearchaeota archaeon]